MYGAKNRSPIVWVYGSRLGGGEEMPKPQMAEAEGAKADGQP